MRADSSQGGASKLSLGNLPPAMLQKAASRLSWVALVCAGVAVAMPFVQHALQPEVAESFAGQLITFTLLNLLVHLDEYCPQLRVLVPQVERHGLVRLLEPGPLPSSLSPK